MSSKKVTIVSSVNQFIGEQTADRLSTSLKGAFFCGTRWINNSHPLVAHDNVLRTIKNMENGRHLIAATVNDAVFLAVRVAVAFNYVRAKDVEIVFFDINDRRHVVLIEDTMLSDGNRNVDFSSYPEGFLDSYPHSVANLADVKPDDGWEPRRVFGENGEFLPEIINAYGSDVES